MKTTTLLPWVLMLCLCFIRTNAQDLQNKKSSRDTLKVYKNKVGPIESLTLQGVDQQIQTPQRSNTASSSDAGATPGNLSVSLSGAATYSVPISVPPGINGVEPKIALTYNSQAGNGLAGWGWNLSGLSTITRIPSTEYHDGNIDPVDFDEWDRFALDGQRLILKTGDYYGADGAIYETENHSNLRITSRGSGFSNGPDYFVVEYPDGSFAYYGESSDSSSHLEWAITYSENPQGISISYQYEKPEGSGTLQIRSIGYGKKRSSSGLYQIDFKYTNRNFPEHVFVGGKNFKRFSSLKEISVRSSQKALRKYELNHLGNGKTLYYRMSSIVEYDQINNKRRPPIYFTYNEDLENEIEYKVITSNLGVLNIEQRNANTISFDLNGNGELDFLAYPKEDKDRFWVFTGRNFGSTIPVNIGAFETIVPTNYLSNNKLLPGQGFTVIQNTADNKVKFRVFGQGSAGPLAQSYQKVWNNPPTYSEDKSCSEKVRKIQPQKYLSGDFNGDGLTDIIAINDAYQKKNCIRIKNCNCRLEDKEITPAVKFINLNRNYTTNFVSNIGTLQRNIKKNDRVFVGDVDGDGKSDILHVTHRRISIYSINSSNRLQLLWETSHDRLRDDRPLIFGDYNGDGKTDFMTPYANNSKDFTFFLSTGNGFYTGRQIMPTSYQETVWNGENGKLTGYNYIPLDVDRDGKTDLVKYKTETYNDTSRDGKQVVTVYSCLGVPLTMPRFGLGVSTSKTGTLKHFPIPIYLNNENPNYGLKLASISDRQISSFSFKFDHKDEMAIKSISNNGVSYTLAYSSIDENNSPNSIYQKGYNQQYPFVDIYSAPGFRILSGITRSVPGSSDIPELYKTFYYREAVSHLNGLGFMDFMGVAQSNWYTDSSDRIYNHTIKDPRYRGAISDTYSKLYYPQLSSIPSDYIEKTVNSYRAYLSSRKVYKLQLHSSTTQNALKGTSIASHFAYDDYNNIKQETYNYSGHGSKTVVYSYNHSNGTPYYNGQLAGVETTSTIGGNSFSSEERYFYQKFLMTSKYSKGNDTFFNRVDYKHDAYGNVIETITKPWEGTQRTAKHRYDPNGIFLTSITDVDGLTTNFVYDTNTGSLLEQTNPYNQKTTYQYDGWNRPIKITDYLGNSSRVTYKGNNFYLTATTTADDGSASSVTYDPLKRKINEGYKDLGGIWKQTSYEYDELDRMHRQSEPHTGSAASQWNTTEYDVYGRVTSQQRYTGKFIQYTYNGLTTTVNDGQITRSSTTDALGNVLRTSDPGGTIMFSYFGNGNLKQSTYGGISQIIEQDGWGRKTKLIDPSAGEYTYSYNGYGELVNETTPKGQTTYQYSDKGQIFAERTVGDQTDMEISYTYDSQTKLVTRISAKDNLTDTSYNYAYDYDTYQRISQISESQGESVYFRKLLKYDSFGRMASEELRASVFQKTAFSETRYQYDSSGAQIGFDGYTIKQRNARGQATSILLGDSSTEQYEYDAFGFVKKAKRTHGRAIDILEYTYDFDPIRGTLKSRSDIRTYQAHTITITDTFTYDSQDRLISQNIGGSNKDEYTYDAKGRITTNSTFGTYRYNDGNKEYQLKNIALNAEGKSHFQSPYIYQHQVTYNAFKKPVEVAYTTYKNTAKAFFEYGPFKNRTASYYGGARVNKKEEATFHKKYASIFPAEVTLNNNSGDVKFVFFKGGDAYSAPVAHIEQFKQDKSDEGVDYYLHRDYLGSILAITKKSGSVSRPVPEVVERRKFDAWGNIEEVWVKGIGSADLGTQTLLDRGFTGHEHFRDTRIIHMNGRIYDPLMHRFLSPDNFIQNPYNTQNYNRYSYVLNNPLMYMDPSGERYRNSSEFYPDWMPPFVAGAIRTLAENWDDWNMKDHINNWFDAVYAKPVREVGRFIRRLLGEKDGSQLRNMPQSVVSGDPLMSPNPSIDPVMTSNGGFPTSKNITPFEVGTEWLTGNGPRHREFTNGDLFTNMLRQHEHIINAKRSISEQILNGELEGRKAYKLDGFQGVGKYLKDYSTLATGGLTGNLAVTYLGSYNLNWKVNRTYNNLALVTFTVKNSSTIQSATRPPIIGYQKWWQSSIGSWLNSQLSEGPMSRTTQTFKWTEIIRLQ